MQQIILNTTNAHRLPRSLAPLIISYFSVLLAISSWIGTRNFLCFHIQHLAELHSSPLCIIIPLVAAEEYIIDVILFANTVTKNYLPN